MFWARSAQQKILNFNPQREAPKKIDPRHEVPPLKNCPSPIVSCRITSYRMGSHRIASYCIVSYRIVSHRTVSHRIGVYRIVPCCIVSTVSYRIVSLCARAFACWCTRVRLRLFAHALARSPAFVRALRVLFHFFASFPGT